MKRVGRPYHWMLVLHHTVRQREKGLVGQLVDSDLVGHAFVEGGLAVGPAPVVEGPDPVHPERHFLT
jgi:hypothetical protein